MKDIKYIMLITYSFDTDYVIIPCESEEEAKRIMEEYFEDEINCVLKESEYQPTRITMDDHESVLVYFDQEYQEYNIDASNYQEHDYAVYKVIEIDHYR